MLLRAGAKWTVLTKRLQTPYDLAVSRGLKIKALTIQDVRSRVAECARALYMRPTGV